MREKRNPEQRNETDVSNEVNKENGNYAGKLKYCYKKVTSLINRKWDGGRIKVF